MSEWTQEQIDACNYDMASGIIAEIREVLDAYGCMHGKDHDGTPPMFYPELVRCAIVSARKKGADDAAVMIEAKCAEVLAKQTGKPGEFDYSVDLNIRLMAVLLPDLAATIRAAVPVE